MDIQVIVNNKEKAQFFTETFLRLSAKFTNWLIDSDVEVAVLPKEQERVIRCTPVAVGNINFPYEFIGEKVNKKLWNEINDLFKNMDFELKTSLPYEDTDIDE